MGHSTIFVNQEVVYYILSGTPRSTQKYFWSDLRVEFSGENPAHKQSYILTNQTRNIDVSVVVNEPF